MAKKKTSKPAAKKKVVAKKKTVKKAVPKKAVAKSARSAKKKVAPKKKAATKRSAPKKASAKKTIVKKAAVKKSAPKKASKPALKKKAVLKKKTAKPTVMPAKSSLPPVTELSEELVEKPAEGNGSNMEEIGEGTTEIVNPGVRMEDPLRTFDKHEFQKATSKGDPRSKLYISSTAKRSIRPSGKKPLWNK